MFLPAEKKLIILILLCKINISFVFVDILNIDRQFEYVKSLRVK